jgi:aminomethyltransferase
MANNELSTQLRYTPLYEQHGKAHAKIVDFSGWAMPLHYGSQIKEHQAVRSACGLFDVSHMGVVDIEGKDAEGFLRYLLANDIRLIGAGQAIYSLMLNEDGGVVDDLLAYCVDKHRFRLVINCANRTNDLDWMSKVNADFGAEIRLREDQGILALQGPAAAHILADVIDVAPATINSFHFKYYGGMIIARTGYTGEDGYEIIAPATQLETLWEALIKAGANPAGLGARDTLRLEAGLCLYGQEMDLTTNPFESNLGWTVNWEDPDRDFKGRAALAPLRENGVEKKLVGLVMQDNGMMRRNLRVLGDGGEEGVITSGSFSPILGKSIALARVPVSVSGKVKIQLRNKLVEAQVVAPVFVRRGKVTTGG